jgi:putative component of membrane protein insertase Oxa1/YidC/SpoIIIJ protein YidD
MAVTFLILFSLIAGNAKSFQEDLRFITRVNPAYTQPSREREDLDFNFRQTNEIRLTFTGMIRLYQIFVSPQGPPACNFTVTCSQFLSRAVRKYGFIHGVLMGADRLTRCTHSTRYLYQIDDATGKAIDYPIDTYYLFTKQKRLRMNNKDIQEESSQ